MQRDPLGFCIKCRVRQPDNLLTQTELSKRNYILDILKKNFQLFGFSQIETPALEKNTTLLGKYGSEGDRLIFKILNSGDKVKKADLNALKDFYKIIQQDPNNVIALTGTGIIFGNLGEYKEASNYLEKALKEDIQDIKNDTKVTKALRIALKDKETKITGLNNSLKTLDKV